MVSIAARNVTVRLGDRHAVNAVSADFAGGTLVGVLGPNGAGKSTLIRAVLGLLPHAGEIVIDGEPLAGMPRAALARRIAYLPQAQTLHWPLSVQRLVSLGRSPHLAPYSRLTEADRLAVERAMIRAEVAHLADRIATELSGGERARAMLARALAVEASVLIVDEPLASLDPAHQLETMELLRAEAAAGVLVIAVLHDLTLAARFCDRVLVLDEGRLVADGDPMATLDAELLARVYGISAYVGEVGQPLLVPRDRLR